MSQLDPANTTMGDLVNAALRESGRLGIGQTALAEDFNIGWSRLQWMLQQWEHKRWLVYVLRTLSFTSTGAVSYTIGPGGNFDTGTSTTRPDRIESAFCRQLITSAPNQIDYPLDLIFSREDYNRISIKQLESFPSNIYLETTWPLGTVYVWPIPEASIYQIHISVKTALPTKFLNQAVVFSIPYEYYAAMLYNLAIRVRQAFQIPTYPGDNLPGLAKDSLNVLRTGNIQVAELRMPSNLRDGSGYNIFSDRFN